MALIVSRDSSRRSSSNVFWTLTCSSERILQNQKRNSPLSFEHQLNSSHSISPPVDCKLGEKKKKEMGASWFKTPSRRGKWGKDSCVRTQHTENVPLTTPWEDDVEQHFLSYKTKRANIVLNYEFHSEWNGQIAHQVIHVQMSFRGNIDNTYSTRGYSPIHFVIRERCLNS